jgi:hypothetical protein
MNILHVGIVVGIAEILPLENDNYCKALLDNCGSAPDRKSNRIVAERKFCKCVTDIGPAAELRLQLGLYRL